MPVIDAVSLGLAVVSIVLGVVAIWLSVLFYRMTVEASKVTEGAAAEIRTTVERLEKVVGTLYSDMFLLVRETVTDFRKHAWQDNTQEVYNAKLAQQLERVREEVLLDINGMFGESSGERRRQMQEVIGGAIRKTRLAQERVLLEMREEIKETVIDTLQKNESPPSIEELFEDPILQTRVKSVVDLRDILQELQEQGHVRLRQSESGDTVAELVF